MHETLRIKEENEKQKLIKSINLFNGTQKHARSGPATTPEPFRWKTFFSLHTISLFVSYHEPTVLTQII